MHDIKYWETRVPHGQCLAGPSAREYVPARRCVTINCRQRLQNRQRADRPIVVIDAPSSWMKRIGGNLRREPPVPL
ncbi:MULTISPECIES: hypothetical protein [unclassified Streptomyces]|uniref:hypothetical protein n=1 Tax=unclassified Streptomyces TaxID=2593676 RepID=UPI000D00862F|nr:hypothetical protein C6Q17_02015 [Burkholderia contaminans]